MSMNNKPVGFAEPDHSIDWFGEGAESASSSSPGHAQGAAASAQSGPDEAPIAGTDDAIGLDARRMVREVAKLKLPGESVTFNVVVSNGDIKVTGSTDSVMLYRHLYELVPKLKVLTGVKSVDISGVVKP